MIEPLPYVVKLRTVASDDAAPVSSEVRCLAYSPVDACVQAIIQTAGFNGAAVSADKSKVESVGPDLEAWRKLRAEEQAKEAKK